jgi:hypothetical protein
MATITVVTPGGAAAGSVEVDDAVFGIEPNVALMHQVVTAQLATLQAELRARETALSEANAQRGALEQRLRAREHEAEAAVAQLRLEAAEVRGSLEAQRAAASQRAEEAESVLARERLRLAELQAEVDALGAERDSVARLYEKTQAELSAARREDLGAQQTASLVQSMKREREACLAELQQASGEKKALRAQLAQAQRELAEARESLADREAQVGPASHFPGSAVAGSCVVPPFSSPPLSSPRAAPPRPATSLAPRLPRRARSTRLNWFDCVLISNWPVGRPSSTERPFRPSSWRPSSARRRCSDSGDSSSTWPPCCSV